MELLKHLDASDMIGLRPYQQMLFKPNQALREICPPTINDLSSVLSKRKDYSTDTIDRHQLVESLIASHKLHHAPESSFESIKRLAHCDCFMIITGQQPGLLGGPLYTFYKVIHAVILAKRLSQERQETFIPVLWDASEDHDFLEIAKLNWLSKNKDIASYQWSGTGDNKLPLFNIPADQTPLDDLTAKIEESTFHTDFTENILEQFGSCLSNSVSYPDFFDGLMWKLFEDDGLVIIRPEDDWFRELSRPLIEREIRNPSRSSAGVNRISDALHKSGLPPQIHKRDDRTSFFLIDNNQRVPVYISGDGFTSDSGVSYSTDDLLNKLVSNPQAFSPSAVLRPIIQDAVLPVAASVLGPSELAYHFLLQDMYDFHQTTRPCLVPRFGLTLVDAREHKLMKRYEISTTDLAANPSALVKRIARDNTALDWREKMQIADSSLSELFDAWKKHSESIDPSLVNQLQKNSSKIQKELERSESLLIRKIAEKDNQVLKHIKALQNSLYPEGGLQERTFNIFQYIFKFGPDFLARLKNLCETIEDGEHHFVLIP
jgi:bacillithiol synthase